MPRVIIADNQRKSRRPDYKAKFSGITGINRSRSAPIELFEPIKANYLFSGSHGSGLSEIFFLDETLSIDDSSNGTVAFSTLYERVRTQRPDALVFFLGSPQGQMNEFCAAHQIPNIGRPELDKLVSRLFLESESAQGKNYVILTGVNRRVDYSIDVAKDLTLEGANVTLVYNGDTNGHISGYSILKVNPQELAQLTSKRVRAADPTVFSLSDLVRHIAVDSVHEFLVHGDNFGRDIDTLNAIGKKKVAYVFQGFLEGDGRALQDRLIRESDKIYIPDRRLVGIFLYAFGKEWRKIYANADSTFRSWEDLPNGMSDDAQRLHQLGEELHASALTYMRDGKYETAQALLRFAINANPDEPWKHYHLGEVLLMQGEIDQAMIALDEANKLLPNNTYIILRLGQVWERKGWNPQAIWAYNQAIALDSNNTLAGVELARIQKSS